MAAGGPRLCSAPLVLIHIAVIFSSTQRARDFPPPTFCRATAQQHRLGNLLRRVFVAAVCIHAAIGVRNILAEWSPLGERHAGRLALLFGIVLAALGIRAVKYRFGAPVIAPHLKHRNRHAWWLAAMVHRLSGIGLAIFLPLHFLALSHAIRGEATLDTFLRWTDQPLVKLAEGGLVFLLTVHLLGGLRVLVIENLDWRDADKSSLPQRWPPPCRRSGGFHLPRARILKP